MTLGEKIRSLRRDRKWSQDELGAKIGMHGRHISRYETDRVRPRPRTLQELARVFGVPLEQLATVGPTTAPRIQDPELREYFELLDTLDPEDRQAVKRVLKVMVTNKRLQSLLAG